MNQRTCIVTRKEQEPDRLIRFVLGPDNIVFPDIKRKLPGRGVWVGAERKLVQEAVEKALFSRSFKTKAHAGSDLAQQVEYLLHDDALSLVSIARKAGLTVSGQAKVEEMVKCDVAKIVLQACDAVGAGKTKLARLIENISDGMVARYEPFTGEALDKAIGGVNTVHIGFMEDQLTVKLTSAVERYLHYKEI